MVVGVMRSRYSMHVLRTVLSTLAWWLAASGSGAATQGAEIKLPNHKFTLPDGFIIEQIAGPPLVDRPITADWDEEGRLYVSDSSGTNDKVDKQLAERPHRILRLVDKDGDGKFDDRTVFADQMMFPEGTMWLDGSLYVSAPPSIWKLTDTDGDGVADERIEWFQGKTLTGCANDLHGPYAGPDGWIYWCKGAFAEQRYERPGKAPFVTKAAHIFRCRPDGSGLEHVMTGGMDNPVDVVFTPGGERIFTTTFLQHPGGGKRDGLIHAVYGGVYGKVHDVIENHPRTGEVLPPLSHLGPAAPCGLTRYESSVFGDAYRDSIFACSFNLHKITRHVLTPQGGTFVARDEDFVVSSNIDFHPTDVQADADGSLVIVNTGGWYKLCCPTSQLWKPDILGGIYRVRRANAKTPEDPRGRKLDWSANVTSDVLAQRLADERPAVRRRAAQTLARRGVDAVPALEQQLKASLPRTREEAVWTLTRIDAPAARAAVRTALSNEADNVRLAALHSTSLWRDAEARPGVLANLKSESGLHVRAAAECLGRFGDRAAVGELITRIEQLGKRVGANPVEGTAPTIADRFIEHSLTYALIEIGAAAELRSRLNHVSPWVRRAALLALDQMEGGQLEAKTVAPRLSSPDPMVRETVAWVVSRHADWGDALAGSLRERLTSARLTEAENGELERQLALFARTPRVADLLAQVVGSDDSVTATRLLALRAMRDSNVKETPPAWWPALAQALGGSDNSIVAQAAATTKALPPAKQPDGQLTQLLLQLAEDGKRPATTRLDAMAAIPGGLPVVTPDVWGFLASQLDVEIPVPQRMSAADAISKARLSPEQFEATAELIGQVGPMEADRLLATFERSTDEQLGLKLLASLRSSKALTSIRIDAIKQRLAKYPASVQEQAKSLYELMNVDQAKQLARLEELVNGLKEGDVRRGQAVFHSTKAACSTCHAMGYLGGRVGPDLTRIGGIRNERDLIEAIAFPSMSFVRSYEPVVVVTHAGKVYNGLLRKDATDEVVLAINATEEVRIPRDAIDELRPSKVSVMPSGLDQQLSPQELADLITFLKAAK